ncbi:MAG: hypothetical protein GKR91_17210 [Pseudomonadales bacterium]|nr:hypothetical protein [Pseudomonadales bacterium]
MLPKISAKLIMLVLVLLIGTMWLLIYRVPDRLTPSPTPALVPAANMGFTEYIEENRRRIQSVLTDIRFSKETAPFGPEYGLNEVVNMRSPFQFLPDAQRCDDAGSLNRTGILIAHGLTDSPYLTRTLGESLAALYPCAIIRGLLTPGHGTVPGDLLDVTLTDWRQTFSWGVDSFPEDVESIVTIGYSNGAALALDYVQSKNRNDGTTSRITKLIAISPGLQSTNPNAQLGVWLQYVWPWLYKRGDNDAAKYESFPTHAGAIFYQLTESVRTHSKEITIPSLFVISADDSTTRSDVVIDFFCNRITNTNKELLLFENKLDLALSYDNCAGIEPITANDTPDRFKSFTHVGLTLPMTDSHYGLDGNYPVCLSHEDFPERLRQCKQDNSGSVYAETSLMDTDGLLAGSIVRRSSFNPSYSELITHIQCFIDANCDTGQ